MPWVENKLSKGREDKKEPKFRGANKKGITLAAITMNKPKDYIRENFYYCRCS
jgi:hypothetical protein